MKRFNRLRYWLLALALLMAVSSIWVITRTTHRPRVTKINYEKIKKGMSYEKAMDVLGRPRFEIPSGGNRCSTACFFEKGPLAPWEWEAVRIWVVYNRDSGIVKDTQVEVTNLTRAEWLKGWRDWVGL